jgi:hypothetical protein
MTHEWPTGSRPNPAERTPRLTAAQRWDVVRMATAGVVTVMALGGSAWFISNEEDPGSATGVAVAAEPPRPAPHLDDEVTVRTSDIVPRIVVEERKPAKRSPAPPAARPARLVTKSAAAAPQPQPRTLGGRLARLITGDGRHAIRPFPTVPDGH